MISPRADRVIKYVADSRLLTGQQCNDDLVTAWREPTKQLVGVGPRTLSFHQITRLRRFVVCCAGAPLAWNSLKANAWRICLFEGTRLCQASYPDPETPVPKHPERARAFHRKAFWVGCLLSEVSSASENTNILFQLTNTNPRTGKFGPLGGCQCRLGALVNGVLCAPVVDSLLAKTTIADDVLCGLTGSWQVEHLQAKSSRILTHHEFLSVESPSQFHQTDSAKPRTPQSLH
jgi:hypothetical protein